MFKLATRAELIKFRIIYHQTTPYSNPIIEAVIYKENAAGSLFYWGDLMDGNFMIFHNSGWAHINFNPFDQEINKTFYAKLDLFIKKQTIIPDYLMFYNVPESLQRYWKSKNKVAFKIRKRRRYQIDNNSFNKINPSAYAAPKNHQLVPIQECSWEDINKFLLDFENTFYSSREDFFQNSFGFILYNEDNHPVAISYLMCLVGRNGECSLTTLPNYRNKGYGYICISNYVRESIQRKINVGWDCFIDNYTNTWIQQYGYTDIIREYDFVSFLK